MPITTEGIVNHEPQSTPVWRCVRSTCGTLDYIMCGAETICTLVVGCDEEKHERIIALLLAAPQLQDACEKTLNALRNCRFRGEEPCETELLLAAAVEQAQGGAS